MSKSILLPMPQSCGYRTALRAAKQAGIIAGNPKREDLERAIAQHNAAIAKPRLTPEQLYSQAIDRLRGIDWEGVKRVPIKYRRTLHAVISTELAALWGLD